MLKIVDVYEQILVETQLGLTPIAYTAQKTAQTLKAHGIKCALVGGYAVHLYGYPRSTNDTDFVVSNKEAAKDVLLMNGFKAIPGSSMSVKDAHNGVIVDLLQQGAKDSAKALPYPDPINSTEIRSIPVIDIIYLLVMKLSSYLSSGIRRLKDKTDVVELMQKHDLPRDYLDGSNAPLEIVEYQSIWDELFGQK
jgi:hypothetical protein